MLNQLCIPGINVTWHVIFFSFLLEREREWKHAWVGESGKEAEGERESESERAREQESERARDGERGRMNLKQAPCLNKEPGTWLDPMSLGSWPAPKSWVRHSTNWATQEPLHMVCNLFHILWIQFPKFLLRNFVFMFMRDVVLLIFYYNIFV